MAGYRLIISTALRHHTFVKGLLSTGLLLLDARVLVGEFGFVVRAHDFLEHRILSLLICHSRAVNLGRSGNYFANLGELGRLRSEGLFLMLWIQNATHTEKLPVSLELRCEICLWKVEP